MQMQKSIIYRASFDGHVHFGKATDKNNSEYDV